MEEQWKTVDRVGNAFANTARQYMRGGRVAKPASNFKPFHRGGRVYDRQTINDAFKARFGPQKQTQRLDLQRFKELILVEQMHKLKCVKHIAA